jgi:hypothetical protein
VDPASQFYVGERTVALKFGENGQIGRIKRHEYRYSDSMSAYCAVKAPAQACFPHQTLRYPAHH